MDNVFRYDVTVTTSIKHGVSECRLVSSIVYDAYRDDGPDDVVVGVDAIVDGRRP